MNTAVAPENAFASADASSISATATSHPREAHASPFLASRTTPRTGWPAASKVRASVPPTLPVMPVIVYIVILHFISLLSVHCRFRRPASNSERNAGSLPDQLCCSERHYV